MQNIDKTDRIILDNFPSFISKRYHNMLNSSSYKDKLTESLRVFDLLLRTLAFALINQYLKRDADSISDREVNSIINENFSKADIRTWYRIFIAIINAYINNEKKLFITELIDLYLLDSNVDKFNFHLNELIKIHDEFYSEKMSESVDNWKFIYDKTISSLKAFIKKLSFLSEYKIILVGDKLNNNYLYWEQVGIIPQSESKQLTTDLNLSKDWYYLMNPKEELLELFPLFIDSKNNSINLKRDSQGNISLFSNFITNKASYLLASLWKLFETEEIVGDILRDIFEIIERIKTERQYTQRFTWRQLQKISSKICRQRLSGISSKFDQELYLQRSHLLSAFKQFMSSDKSCFVLTGNSGVGKSSFVISLMNEYNHRHHEVCILGYNGGTIDAQLKIEDLLTSDFEEFITAEKKIPFKLNNIFREINRIDDIENKTVLLIFDAINENPNSKLLLSRMNQLVESSPWKWLKIIITSRPEAWKTIKRGINLSELHYFKDVDDSIDNNIGFSYSFELTPFRECELAGAYKKYSQKYKLKTSYEELNIQLKETLRDPLMMLLISLMHPEQFLPTEVQHEKIFEHYLEYLLKTNRLEHRDLDFIRNEIMPLMINSKELNNRISSDVLNTVITTNGYSLSHLIKCSDKLSDGKSVNQSFQNLCDAKILEIRGGEYRYEIGFEFERFYDFFAGNRLFKLNIEDDPVPKFMKLATLVDSKPFLWGPIANALKLLLENDSASVDNLAFFADMENLKNLLVHSITSYGNYKLEETEEFIMSFLIQKNPQITKTLQGLFRPSYNRKVEIRKKIALEVAYNISSKKTLELGTNDSNPNIRSLSVRFIFYLAQNNPNIGISVLDNLKSKIGNSLLRINRNVADSFFGVSFLMFFKYYKIPEIKGEILNIWKFVLARISLVNELLSQSTKKSPAIIIKKMFIWIFIKKSFMIQLKKFEKSGAMIFTRKDLKLFFKESHNKEILSELIPYIDNRYGSILDIKEKLCMAARDNDLFTMYIFTVLFTCRLVSENTNTLDVAVDIFKASLKKKPATSYVAALLLSLSIAIIYKKEYDEKLWKEYEDYINDFYLYSRNVCGTKHHKFLWAEQGRYYYLYAKFFSTKEASPINHFVRNSLKENDQNVIIKYIKDLTETIIRFGFSKAMVEHILVFTSANDKQVEGSAIESMCRLHNYFTPQIDDILKEKKLSPNFKKLISSHKINESIGDLMVRLIYEFWRDNLVIHQDESVLNQIIYIAEKAVDNKNIGGWIQDVLKNTLIQIIDNK